MTLVLVLASEHEVHMTCDFRLTYLRPRNRKPDDDVHKLIRVARGDFEAIIGVTGWAYLDTTPIATWVLEKTSQLPFDAKFDDLLDVLRSASEPLSRVSSRHKKDSELTFVIAAIQGSQSVVCVLSNFQNLRGRFLAAGKLPGHELMTDITRPSSVQLFAAGSGSGFVYEDDRKPLEYLLRSGLATPERIQAAMASLNERVAGRTNTVSRGCYAASQNALGLGQTRPFLVEQVGNFNPPEFEELFKRMGIVLNPKILPDGTPMPIQMTGSSSVSYTPSPNWFREQFKLRPDDAELWNNFGIYEQGNGHSDKAREAYEKAIELNPEEYNAARNLANLLWGISGEQSRVNELFEIALKNPDTTQRRETLAQRANLAVFRDRDIEAARGYYAEALNGELLPNVSALWARTMLIFEPPERWEHVEDAVDEVLQAVPLHPVARAAKALCTWWVHRDIKTAKELAIAASNDNPNELWPLSIAVYMSLADGDLNLAESLLNKLVQEIGNEDSQEALSYRTILNICRSMSLSEIISPLEGQASFENLVTMAILFWAKERDSECAEIIARLSDQYVVYQARIELTIVQCLLAAGSPQDSDGSSRDYVELSGRLLDSTTLRGIAAHPELSEPRRKRLNAALRVVSADVRP